MYFVIVEKFCSLNLYKEVCVVLVCVFSQYQVRGVDLIYFYLMFNCVLVFSN